MREKHPVSAGKLTHVRGLLRAFGERVALQAGEDERGVAALAGRLEMKTVVDEPVVVAAGVVAPLEHVRVLPALDTGMNRGVHFRLPQARNARGEEVHLVSR